jgi:hypothetical protein
MLRIVPISVKAGDEAEDELLSTLIFLSSEIPTIQSGRNWLFSEKLPLLLTFNGLRFCALKSTPCSIPDGRRLV